MGINSNYGDLATVDNSVASIVDDACLMFIVRTITARSLLKMDPVMMESVAFLDRISRSTKDMANSFAAGLALRHWSMNPLMDRLHSTLYLYRIRLTLNVLTICKSFLNYVLIIQVY